jgi:hypothetical protein
MKLKLYVPLLAKTEKTHAQNNHDHCRGCQYPSCSHCYPEACGGEVFGLLGRRRYRRGRNRGRVSLAGLRLRLSSVRLCPLRLRAGVLRGLRAGVLRGLRAVVAPQMPGEFGIRPKVRVGLRLKSAASYSPINRAIEGACQFALSKLK